MRPAIKAIAGGFTAVGMLCIFGLLIATFWLLWETSGERIPGEGLRIRTVPLAALRGRWPELRSAKWYRRLFGTMAIAWFGSAISIAAHEMLGRR